uniref:Sel1 repeat family protein n=1 Tax=Alexandrium monilatum TaxID=311494 RepID=A0A7S4QEH5_9DINO
MARRSRGEARGYFPERGPSSRLPMPPALARPRLAVWQFLWLCTAVQVAGAGTSGALGQLREAATSGDAKAQLQLGLEYLYGSSRTVAKPKEATHWLDKAVAGGDTDAMVVLAKLLREGSGAIDPDARRSLQLAEKAAAGGSAEGMDMLAEAYHNSIGVGDIPDKKRKKLATKWLKKAAANGAFRAQVQLADSYREGKQLARDGELAVKWYEKAAATADLLSQTSSKKVSPQALELIRKVHLTLGKMYYEGHGTEKNKTVALEHLRRAADMGDGKAREAAGEVEKQLDKDSKLQELLKDPDIEKLLKDNPEYQKSTDPAGIPAALLDHLLKGSKVEMPEL